MRFVSVISTLAALVIAVACASPPVNHRQCLSEVGCELTQSVNERRLLERSTRTVRSLTNAELLRRSLPLKYPVLRRGTPVRRTNPSAGPPPKTITHRGVIEVINASNDAVLGYVSKDPLGAEDGALFIELDASNGLVVTFETDQTGSGTALNLAMENSGTNFPFLGLVQGIGNTDSFLSPGSPEYTFLAGTAETVPGSTPAVVGNSVGLSVLPTTSESAIWTFDGPTGVLSPHWVNPDRSLPSIQGFTDNIGIVFGGDYNASRAKYSPSSVIIYLKLTSL